MSQIATDVQPPKKAYAVFYAHCGADGPWLEPRRANLTFFTQKGFSDPARVDYFLVVNGATTREADEVGFAPLSHPRWRRVWRRPNTGLDFGAWAHAIESLGGLSSLQHQYEKFLFVNDSIRGPIFRPDVTRPPLWEDIVGSMLNDCVKLAGITINCCTRPDVLRMASAGSTALSESAPAVHVQSMLFALDASGLALLRSHGVLEPAGVARLGPEKCDFIVGQECAMSAIVLRAGFNIDCLATGYRGRDYRTDASARMLNTQNGWHGNPWGRNGYFGRDLNPFETLFFKTNNRVGISALARCPAMAIADPSVALREDQSKESATANHKTASSPMHEAMKEFLRRVKAAFPTFFAGAIHVVDIGSGDINGNNRYLFDEACHYVGIDVVAGPNVDVVSRGALFRPPDGRPYDLVISTECLEHDIDFVGTLRNMVTLVRPGGFMVFTCASTDRGEHGTQRTSPIASLSTQLGTTDALWYPNYYRNLTAEDVTRAVPVHLYFDRFSFEYQPDSHDLYFWGVRNARPYARSRDSAENRAVQTMEEIYDRYDTDKNTRCHRYTQQYAAILDRFRYTGGVRYLELGAGEGESLRAARAYLCNAARIVGVDNNESSRKHASAVDHIYIEIGDATEPKFLREVHRSHGPFDIILDDASHIAEDVARSFEALFPVLRDGGVYIVEDTVCMQDSAYKRRASTPNALLYFAQYLPLLNQWNLQDPAYRGPHSYAVDPAKITKHTADPFELGIDSIHFGVSFIAVQKRVRRNWLTPPPPPAKPTAATPAKPVPSKPAAASPTPAKPTPAAKPVPSKPTPAAKPVPSKPTPVAKPIPTKPTPAKPVPAKPTPAKPALATPKSGS